MNKARIGIGSVAAALLATFLAACAATPPAAPGTQPVRGEAYSHDAYFY